MLTVIKKTDQEKDIKEIARLMAKSFKTVADQFSLTKQNCPSHPAFTSAAQIKAALSKGSELYQMFTGEERVGAFILSANGNDTVKVEKLCVAPDARNLKYGQKMVSYILEQALRTKQRAVTLDIIDKNTHLKDWYIRLGFRQTEILEFDHLPFKVCRMERTVNGTFDVHA